jgi:hypothetical protein
MSPNPVVMFALLMILIASTICACLLLPYLPDKLCDFYESLLRIAVAMALAPWTAFVCALLCAILFLPLAPVGFFVGIIAPYIVAARWESGRR